MKARLRSPAAAHRVLADRQRGARAGAASQAVAAAGMPAVAVDRPEQPVRDGEVLPGGAGAWREAHRRRRPAGRARPASASSRSRLTLLCQNAGGYRNVTRLVSRAYLEGQKRGVPLVERAWLTQESLDGLIALSGATEGDVGRALLNGREADAGRALDVWLALLPRPLLHRAAAPRPRRRGKLHRRCRATRGRRGVPRGGHQRRALSEAG